MSWLPAPDPAATCLVTGASSGIGAAISRELAARGHGVTLLARREDRLRSLAQELAATHGVRAEALRCDLADPGDRAGLPARLEALDLRVDVLVNNAGLGTSGRFAELDAGGEVAQVRVMCEAVVDLCSAFAPSMTARHSGAVLVVSSMSALQPMPNMTTYAATKAFSLSFGEGLHAELRSAGVAVTMLCPGPVATEFFATNGPNPVERAIPRSLWQEPTAVARAAIDGLAKNRRVVMHSPAMRVAMAARHLAPRGALLRVLDRYFRVSAPSP
jgi:short-subunit dehydrogenase